MVKIDHSAIYLRSENARLRLKEISHHLKKTSQRLKYSLSLIEKEGFIRNPYCIFDYSYFGLILFRVYFRGSYISEHGKVKIINELSNNPYLVSLYELTGEFDLVAEFVCPNPSRFNKELKKIVDSTPKLNDYKIILNLVTYIYPRHYLTKNQDIQNILSEKLIGGDRGRESFNQNELIVMKNLLLNPRMQMKSLATASSLNVKTVKSVMKNLTKKYVIKGFKYVVDINKLGINGCRLFLKLHNLSIEREMQLMEYMLKTRGIVQVNKTVGDWDIEIDIEALDKSRVRYIIMQVKEEFKDLIERFNLIEIYNYTRRVYLPMYLFKEESN